MRLVLVVFLQQKVVESCKTDVNSCNAASDSLAVDESFVPVVAMSHTRGLAVDVNVMMGVRGTPKAKGLTKRFSVWEGSWAALATTKSISVRKRHA